MTARLVAINGPYRKSVYPLVGEILLGRDPNNSVHLEDPWVSAQHCTISDQQGRYILNDLDSHAGTFVNGIPVKQRELKPGDEIGIGNSLFLFQQEAPSSAPSNKVQIDDHPAPAAQAVELHADELTYLLPEALAALSPSDRVQRNLSALVGISRAIGSVRDEESLPWQLLGMIFDVIPADRGLVLLLDENSQDIRSEVAWDRVHGPEYPVSVSRDVVRRVIDQRVSLWNCSPPPSATISKQPDPSFLCVPMISKDLVIGVVYVDSTNPGITFSPRDLELLAAIAGLGVVGIENARQFDRLNTENQQLRAEVSLTHDMVGRSARMREVYQFVGRVAPSDSTVLIYGESGTGKELAARAIHKNSSRRDQPFVGLNCAALTETLLESELFGHEKGAFTSAVSQKKGYLEVAEGGTVFLDEIGELSPILQAKLLRVLQEREFVRVGGTRPIKIDVRFLAATNKDLQKAVRDERFRGDLYHRLNVISLTLPPLRERTDDIPELAEHFVARYSNKCKRPVAGISEMALVCLQRYAWPGNIRELENAMERAVVVGNSDHILPEDLPEIVQETVQGTPGTPPKYHEAILHLKRQMILQALEQADGSMTEAAKLLDVHPNYLHRLVTNLELRSKLKKQGSA